MSKSDYELSTDSFVDIVGNTVGVVIILTLLAMVTGSVQLSEADTRHAELKTLRQEIDDIHAELEKIQNVLSQDQQRTDDIQAQIKKIIEQRQTESEEIASLRAQQEALEREHSSIQKLSGLNPGQRLQQLAELEKQLAAAKAALSAVDKTQLADPATNAESLAQKIQEEQKKIAAMHQRIRAMEEDYSRRLAQELRNQEALQQLLKEIAVLEKELVQRVEINAIQESRSGKKNVNFECYVDADGVGRIRLVSPAYYDQGDDGLWTGKKAGEDAFELHKVASMFQRRLRYGGEKQRDAFYIYFLVRPEAYNIFRSARKEALTQNWQTEWEQMDAGTSIQIGRKKSQ